MAMSPVIKNKPTTTSSLRNLGLFWDDEDDDDVENGQSARTRGGRSTAGRPRRLRPPGRGPLLASELSDTLRLQPLTFRAKVYAVLEYSVHVRCTCKETVKCFAVADA